MKVERLSDPTLLEHYRQLAEEELPTMAPLYHLVNRLCGKEYAAILPAGTSHDVLIIGAEGADVVMVDYHPDTQSFHLRYQPRKTGKPKRYVGDADIAERLVDSLALRLLIQERHPEPA